MFRRTLAVIVATLCLLALAGCFRAPGVSAEPEWAVAISEEILQAFNSGNYTALSAHFDAVMKSAMTEAGFAQTRRQIQEAYGDYLTKEFSSVEKNVQGVYTVVTYKAVFSKAEVRVKVVFRETEEGVFVSGLWFQ